MSNLFSILLPIVLLSVESRGNDSFSILKEELKISGPSFDQLETIDDLRDCDAGVAYNFLRLAYRNSGPELTDTVRASGVVAAENTDLRNELTSSVKNLPILVENSTTRLTIFQVLALLRSNWALALAGETLSEDAPLKTQKGDLETQLYVSDFHARNSQLAAWVIGTFNIPSYPGSEEISDYSEELTATCKVWWEKNSDLASAYNLELSEPRKHERKAQGVSHTDSIALNDNRESAEFSASQSPIWAYILVAIVCVRIIVFLLRPRKDNPNL